MRGPATRFAPLTLMVSLLLVVPADSPLRSRTWTPASAIGEVLCA